MDWVEEEALRMCGVPGGVERVMEGQFDGKEVKWSVLLICYSCLTL